MPMNTIKRLDGEKAMTNNPRQTNLCYNTRQELGHI